MWIVADTARFLTGHYPTGAIYRSSQIYGRHSASAVSNTLVFFVVVSAFFHWAVSCGPLTEDVEAQSTLKWAPALTNRYGIITVFR